MGRDLAPKRLRICPGLMEHRRPEEILAVLCPRPTRKSEIPEKFGRCAPKDTQVDHKNRDFSLESRENEDHAKMMHSISDLLSRYRLCYDPKNNINDGIDGPERSMTSMVSAAWPSASAASIMAPTRY